MRRGLLCCPSGVAEMLQWPFLLRQGWRIGLCSATVPGIAGRWGSLPCRHRVRTVGETPGCIIPWMAQALGTGRGQLGSPPSPWQPGGMQEVPGQQRRLNPPQFPEDLGAEIPTLVGRWSPCVPLNAAACPLSLCRCSPARQSLCQLKRPRFSAAPPAFCPLGEGEHSPCPSSCRCGGAESGGTSWPDQVEMLCSCPRLGGGSRSSHPAAQGWV